MGRIARFSVAVAAIASLAGTASAASIKLTSPGGLGTVRVDMWFEDLSRDADLLALQFDLDLVGSSVVPAPLPSPNEANVGSIFPNTTRSNGTAFQSGPFQLNQAIGDPPGAIDVRTVHAGNAVFDVNSLAAFATCVGPANSCERQDAGLAASRVYLGSFELSDYTGSPVYYSLTGIFGEGDDQPQNGTDQIIIELRTGSGPNNRAIEGLAPEPASLALLGLALAGLGFARRS